MRSDCGSKQSDTRATGVSPFTASYGHPRGEAATPADAIYGFDALAYER